MNPTPPPTAENNPFFKPSNLPHGAFPFDEIQKSHFIPALDVGIEKAKANLDRIRQATDAPTFENTVLALETASGSCLRRLFQSAEFEFR